MYWIDLYLRVLYLFYTNKNGNGAGRPKLILRFSVLGFDGLLQKTYRLLCIGRISWGRSSVCTFYFAVATGN